ncbi:restriction endonuclease subunit S [Acinetobacter terrestris]|uniref:restriction endonuclease subunit S n=1 Tax=Acinetobacter terrestris TaxID=2529843 RepID=UPI0035262A3B
MSLDNLPENWISLELGRVIEYGKTSKVEPTDVNDDTWVLELEDIEKDTSKILNTVYFAERQSKSTKNKFKNGDVLYGKLRPYLNKVVVAPRDGICTTEIIPLDGAEYILNKFLFYWLKGNNFQNYVKAVSYGVNMPRLGTNDGLKAPFILVPIAEQQEIVRQLDVMLAQVEQIKARLDAIPAILKKFRQSVLADAVSGKLTEEWRANNIHLLDVKKDYSSLIIAETNILNEKKSELKKIKEEKFKLRSSSAYFEKHDFSCPLGWKVFPFFELALLNRGFDLPNSARVEGKYPILSAGGLIGYHNEYKVEGVCVTVGRSGSVGRVFISEKNSWPLNTTLYVKDFGFSNPSYVYWVLKSMNLEKYSSSTAVPSLNRNEFMFEPVAIPPIKEQLEILKRVEQFFKYSEYIESLIQSAQKRVNLLTQSILAKAFSGELTAEWREQHQELITGVNSAEALLAKIQAEREANQPVKKTRAKKEA